MKAEQIRKNVKEHPVCHTGCCGNHPAEPGPKKDIKAYGKRNMKAYGNPV